MMPYGEGGVRYTQQLFSDRSKCMFCFTSSREGLVTMSQPYIHIFSFLLGLGNTTTFFFLTSRLISMLDA
jgi:hypothetical protein